MLRSFLSALAARRWLLPARPTGVSESFALGNYVCAILASAAIGYAIAFNWGARAPRAFQPLVAGGLLVIWRLVELARRRPVALVTREMLGVPLVILFALMAWGAHEDEQIRYAIGPWPLGRDAQLAIGALVLTYLPSALGVREPGWLANARFALLLALVTLVGREIIVITPRPRIDVWDMQQRAVDVLLAGRNPYQHVAVMDTFAGMTIPFVYPPTVIYTGAIGKLLLGDIRYAHLFFFLLTALALRVVAARAPVGLPAIGQDAPALVFLLQPKLFFILEQAWIDVVPLGFAAAGFALLLSRWRMAGVVLLGLGMSCKQTMFWFLPLLLVFVPLRRREWIVLGATLAAALVPFVVWDFGKIWASNFTLHANLPPRHDSLGFMAWYHAKYFYWPRVTHIAWLGGLAVLALGAWRLRRSLPALGFAASAIYFLFFFFQKQAFANYHFFTGGLAALAAALSLHGGEEVQRESSLAARATQSSSDAPAR